MDVSCGFSFGSVLAFIDTVFVVDGRLRADDRNITGRDVRNGEVDVLGVVVREPAPSREERILRLGLEPEGHDLAFCDRPAGEFTLDRLLECPAVETDTLRDRLKSDLCCGLWNDLLDGYGVPDSGTCRSANVSVDCNPA